MDCLQYLEDENSSLDVLRKFPNFKKMFMKYISAVKYCGIAVADVTNNSAYDKKHTAVAERPRDTLCR